MCKAPLLLLLGCGSILDDDDDDNDAGGIDVRDSDEDCPAAKERQNNTCSGLFWLLLFIFFLSAGMMVMGRDVFVVRPRYPVKKCGWS